MPLGSWNRVSVFRGGAIPKCVVKSCKSKATYSIFGDDGEPMMSRLSGCSCRKHLGLAIDAAWRYNRSQIKKQKKK
jgi:hypothetical protein